MAAMGPWDRPARRLGPYVATIDDRQAARGSTFAAAKNAVGRRAGRAAIVDTRSGRRWERVGGRWLRVYAGGAEVMPAPPPAAGGALLHAHFTAPQDDDEDGDD